MDYRTQRLKEDLTNAQRRNKNQRKQLANYNKAYDKKCTECSKYKQALNEIRELCVSNMVAWDCEGDCGTECYVDGFKVLQIIDKYTKEDD